MASAATPLVLSHWYHLFENLQASPMEFFESVERSVESREVPEAERSRVDHHEGGILSAKREYLRVSRGRLAFDICAAPFGNGFFVSWWLGELRRGPGLLFALFAGTLVLTAIILKMLGFFLGSLALLIGLPLGLWFLARNPPELLEGWDDPLIAVPVLGPLYEAWFRPATYYKTDTTLMFRESIRRAVMEVVDEMTKAKGLRALTELERKPILEELFKR